MSSKNHRNYVPYPFYWDDVPLDLSFIYEDEKPAGKRGFLKVDGSRFVFEDGTEARFWGTNFNSGLNFPSFEFSEKLAKRLAKIGINIVRFHQMDSEWATPNIFQFTKGKRKGNTLELDPESMKRLDYLIYCLKNEGIYIYMDLLTYRKFKSGDGVEAAFELADAAKPYCIFDRKLIELQKKFSQDLWTHHNPYTGLAYKDDPAIVMTEIVNEADMFFNQPLKIPYYNKQLEAMYFKWLDEQKLPHPEGAVDFCSYDKQMLEFLMKVQQDYYMEMMEHLRGIGVKIPITGTNWAKLAAIRKTQLVTDFTDAHTYWYAWKWKEDKKEFDNRPMVSQVDSMQRDLSFQRVLDKPFFVSEWDNPWPNEWRAESSLFLAALGGFQDWTGFAIHTYSYSTMEGIDRTGKEVSSTAIGSVPYREGVFTTWNDPAKFGLFYHAALMFRRKDVQSANKSVGIRLDDMALYPHIVPALNLSGEKHKVGMEFGGQAAAADNVIAHDEEIVNTASGEVLSDTGELYRNWEKGFGWIDTERTKVAYGFLDKAGKLELKDLRVEVKTDFATVAVSSLTDAPISESHNLLLTTIGRSENTGMKFNDEHTEMLDVGHAPILVEAIEAEISIKTSISTLRVWAVNPEGFFAGVVPSEYRDGVFSFKTGEQFVSMYYLIQAE